MTLYAKELSFCLKALIVIAFSENKNCSFSLFFDNYVNICYLEKTSHGFALKPFHVSNEKIPLKIQKTVLSGA